MLAMIMIVLNGFGHRDALADDDAGESVRDRIKFIGSIHDKSLDVDLLSLIEMTKDTTQVPNLSSPGPIPTISSIAGEKLSSLRGNPTLEKLVLAAIKETAISSDRFTVLLKGLELDKLPDRITAELQELCIGKGDKYVNAVLRAITNTKDQIDERYDLLIAHGLSSAETVSYACLSILKRRDRNLLWNSQLVELCKTPIEGHEWITPDFMVPYDTRCLVLRALRKNGFPSKDIVFFLNNFHSDIDSELHWQVVATRFALLNDREALSLLLEAIASNEWRDIAAKAMSENVVLPYEKRTMLLALSKPDDLPSQRIGNLLIDQFKPKDFTEPELKHLESLFIGPFFGRKSFKDWMSEEQRCSP